MLVAYVMKSVNKSSLLRLHLKSVTSGILFVGSYESNFYLIIHCPVHVATVIYKAFEALSIPTRFYGGSISVSQLALPEFLGKFIYRDSSGKVKKYDSAFVYPLDMNREFDNLDFSFISAVLSIFADYKWQYYDKKDRSIKTLFTHLCPDYIAYVQSILAHFVQSVPGSPSD